MNSVHLGSVDLNLLRVFDALAEESSVTRAGDRLGLSQSAMSHALGRLRRHFDDPLFVRSADGMRATPRAAEIAPALREALLQLQRAIDPIDFDPARTDRRFTIATGSYVAAVLLPRVIERIHAEAPAAEVRVLAFDHSLEESLRRGRIDLALGAFGGVSDRLGREPLFEERAVWVVRADHPAAKEPPTLERLASLPHVSAVPAPPTDIGASFGWGRDRPFLQPAGGDVVEEMLRSAGLHRAVRVRVQDVYAGLAVVSRTDMAMLAPQRIAEIHAKSLNLKVLDEPSGVAKLHLEALWSREAGANAAIDWLRRVLREEGAKT